MNWGNWAIIALFAGWTAALGWCMWTTNAHVRKIALLEGYFNGKSCTCREDENRT